MSKRVRIVLGSGGIACLLAVILFPVFQKVPENRKWPAAGCASNMKQLGLALIQYSQDYDETLPAAAPTNGKGWREAVYPYVKFTGVYRCPEDTPVSSQDTPQNLPTSYASNIRSWGKSVFTESGENITLMDTRGYHGEDWDIVSPAFLPSTGRRLYAHFPPHAFYEHPVGLLNVLFEDGHVKRLDPIATLSPVNLWTRDNKPFAGQDLVNAQVILKHAEDE